MTKIRYMSDLHIEHSNFNINTDDCDVLVLAGDICAYMEDFDLVLRKVPKEIPIILVAGNHEFEQKEMKSYTQSLRNYLTEYGYDNVHFLDNEYKDICGVRFVGSTLWSDGMGYFKSHDEKDSEMIEKNNRNIQNGILNYLSIYHEESKAENKILTLDLMKEEFYKSCNFIKETLDNSELPCVVVTHFAPMFKSSYKNEPLSSFWANELPELMGKAKYWIHGHIHKSKSYDVNGTVVVSNTRGVSKFYNQSEDPSFDPKATIVIKKKVKP